MSSTTREIKELEEKLDALRKQVAKEGITALILENKRYRFIDWSALGKPYVVKGMKLQGGGNRRIRSVPVMLVEEIE